MRGEGQFTRTFTLLKEGDLHLSFYPANNGESFGGVYFAPKKSVPAPAGKKVVGIGPGWQRLQRIIGDNYGGSIGGYSDDEQKCGEYFEKVLSWAKPGDTFVMMFAFDEEKFGHSQMVPQKYQDMLPKPWQEIKEQINRGEVLELKGKARGLDELIKSTALLQPFKSHAVKVGPEGLRIYEVNRTAAEFSEKSEVAARVFVKAD